MGQANQKIALLVKASISIDCRKIAAPAEKAAKAGMVNALEAGVLTGVIYMLNQMMQWREATACVNSGADFSASLQYLLIVKN